MARPLRIEFEGALYHVTSRGNARQDIFLDDKDRDNFLKSFGRISERFGWICHAYCLMNNHYHLLIETPRANLSQGMQLLNSMLSQRFNRRHGRVGHVLQGRFKAILVEKESHLLEPVSGVRSLFIRSKVLGWFHDSSTQDRIRRCCVPRYKSRKRWDRYLPERYGANALS